MSADYGPLHLPGATWRRADVATALRQRDIGALMCAAQHHTGASQTRIAAAVGMTQARASEVMRGHRRVDSLAVLERVAAGLSLPDAARMLLGLAPTVAADATTVDDLTAAAGVIARSYPSQSHAASDIRSRLLTSGAADVLVVRGLGLLALNDSLLRGMLTAGRHELLSLRVLLLNPDGDGAHTRADEIGEGHEAFATGVRLAEARLRELADHPMLDVAVYLYDRLPTWRLVAVDDAVFVGTFDADWEGHVSPIYRLDAATGGALYRGMRRTFSETLSSATRVI